MNGFVTFIIINCITLLSLTPLFVFLGYDDRKYAYERTEQNNSITIKSDDSDLENNFNQKVVANTSTISTTSKNSLASSTSTSTVATSSSQKNSSTSKVQAASSTTQESVYYEVPFTAQAPTANWEDPRQQNACEEASVLMAMKWVRGKNLSTDESLQEILSMTEFGQKRYGDHRDLSASTTQDLVRNYFNFKNSELTYNITKEGIIRELEQGKIVVAPVDGTVLNNPYFVPPGPKEHMIVIHGFDRESKEFITNDPGTSRGKDFRYSFDLIEKSLRDYNTGYHENMSEERTAMISFEKS